MGYSLQIGGWGVDESVAVESELVRCLKFHESLTLHESMLQSK